MKHYFKYSKGYINLDTENLFMTNSGNWSETQSLSEKSPITIKANKKKNTKYDFFIFVLIVLVLVTVFQALNQIIPKIIPIPLIVITLAVYRYFKKESGNRYRIPLDKITEVLINNDEVTIKFTNAIGEPDAETIHKVEPKGIAILKEKLA